MNEYGLDVSYFKGKLSLILRDIGNYTPEEMYRELCRAAEVAKPTQKEPNRIKLLPMPTEENPRQWYFDCDDLYIDVEDLNGEVSIFVKNRSNNATGWKELIEKPPEEKCVQCGVRSGNGHCLGDIFNCSDMTRQNKPPKSYAEEFVEHFNKTGEFPKRSFKSPEARNYNAQKQLISCEFGDGSIASFNGTQMYLSKEARKTHENT